MEKIDKDEIIELLQEWRDAAQQAVEDARQADLFSTSKYLAKLLEKNSQVLAKLQHSHD